MGTSSRWQSTVLTILLVIIAATGASPVRVEGAASITRGTTGNGATGSTGAGKVIRSTLGQSIAGGVGSPNHSIEAGFWPGTDTPTTGLAEQAATTIERYQLYAGVPNPFNPQTTIAFDVPAPGGRVRLSIHDVSGRLVKTLVDGQSLPGHRVIAWNGTDDAGHGVSSGIFICSLEAGGERMTQKLVLLR